MLHSARADVGIGPYEACTHSARAFELNQASREKTRKTASDLKLQTSKAANFKKRYYIEKSIVDHKNLRRPEAPAAAFLLFILKSN